MALTVEDGTVVAGADSYISLTDANTYFTNHGSPSSWTGATDAAKEGALRYGTSWINQQFEWSGWIADDDQVLDWPRGGVYDDEGRAISSTTIPQSLKDAVCEAALEHIAESLNTGVERGGKLLAEKYGPIEFQYSPTAPAKRSKDYIEELLAPFVRYRGYRLVRA